MATTGNPIVDAEMRAARLYPNRAIPGVDGTIRKAHYGEGKQPWDFIVEAGWAPEFAAGCVLRYLRRTKDPTHSLESARWYFARLGELAERGHAKYVLGQLRSMLIAEELERLR
jgi:hypothetical protein